MTKQLAFTAGTRPHVAKADNIIFVGGQMSLDTTGRVLGADITTQTRNAFEALKRALNEAGASMADVVKHNIYFRCDGDDAAIAKFLEELDQVRIGYFSDPGPTTTEIRVGFSRDDVLIQVDAWAVVGGEKERLMPPGHWNWGQDRPWSHGWKVGDMIFIGGQRSLDDAGNPIGVGDIEAQTANVFRNMEILLEAGGATEII